MAKTLPAIRATVRQFLRDEFDPDSNSDFKDDELDLHIGACLVELSGYRPRDVKETLSTTAGSKDLDVSTIKDWIEKDRTVVEFRVGRYPAEKRNCTVIGDTLTIDIDFTPAGSETVYVFCKKVHELTESGSSLEPDLEKVLIDGAVASAALAWINEIRVQITQAIARIADVNTAIDAMSGRISQAITDLQSGRDYIANKHSEAMTAVGNMSEQITQAITDLTSGRALIGNKKTEAESALAKVSDQIANAINDLNIGREYIDDERQTADTAIDSVNERIEQALTDLTTGRGFIGGINVFGMPQQDYSNYAARELQTATEYLKQASGYLSEASSSSRFGEYAARDLQAARTYIDQARSYMAVDQITTEYGNYAARQLNSASTYLSQAKGYLEADRPATLFGNTAARELSNATAYLNQSGGYIRELTTRLNTTKLMTSYQVWANNKLALYQAALRGLGRPATKRRYPKS